jgi:hypothetical protein
LPAVVVKGKYEGENKRPNQEIDPFDFTKIKKKY